MSKAIENFAQRLGAAKLALEAISDKSILHQAVGLPGPRPDQVVRPASVEELAVILPAAKAAGSRCGPPGTRRATRSSCPQQRGFPCCWSCRA